MFFRLSIVIGLLCMSFLLAGCNGARELDEVGNVIAIGLDEAEEEDMILVSYQFAVPQPEGGKADASKSTTIMTNKVSTIAEALNLTNQPFESFYGSKAVMAQREFYRWWMRLGVKFDLGNNK